MLKGTKSLWMEQRSVVVVYEMKMIKEDGARSEVVVARQAKEQQRK